MTVAAEGDVVMAEEMPAWLGLLLIALLAIAVVAVAAAAAFATMRCYYMLLTGDFMKGMACLQRPFEPQRERRPGELI